MKKDQAKPKVKFDDKQQAVIDCNDKVIVAEAFAGAGKTTTADGYARARPDESFLYLCFGKANKVEASRRFGPNVQCKTTHGIAFGAVGRKYGSRVTNRWTARSFSDELGLGKPRLASIAMEALKSFFSSADERLDYSHLRDVIAQRQIKDAEAQWALDVAIKAWARMQKIEDSLSLPHDAYLKMWALTKPQLPFSRIILDEAQDTNPVTEKIVAEQTKAKQLLIGDRHQSIYAFRKALNAMESFASAGATVLKMPRTWRFGAETAGVANELLGRFKGEDTKIIGMGNDVPYVKGAKTFLARANATLFQEAAQVRGKGVYWVGGIGNYRIDLVGDAHRLWMRDLDQIRDVTLRRYVSWQQYQDEVDATKDVEGKILVKLVDTYRHDLPDLLADLRTNEVHDESRADLTLTTGHKGKGFDWDFVRIGDDFECLFEAQDAMKQDGMLNEAQKQEINLLYVALTRARKQALLNVEMRQWLDVIRAEAPGLEGRVS